MLKEGRCQKGREGPPADRVLIRRYKPRRFCLNAKKLKLHKEFSSTRVHPLLQTSKGAQGNDYVLQILKKKKRATKDRKRSPNAAGGT